MKRLSISLPAIALVLALALSGTAFTSAPGTSNNTITTTPAQHYQNVHFLKKNYFDQSYFWYWADDDTYNDYGTVLYEEWELGQYYYPGVEIDTNPGAGTLLMKGYPYYCQPHNTLPLVFLYAHFTY